MAKQETKKNDWVKSAKYTLELIGEGNFNVSRPDSVVIGQLIEVIRYLVFSKQIKLK